jgi:hypothetical protein
VISPRPEIERLLEQASRAESEAVRVALIEEAIALADAAGDLDAGFSLRQQLLSAALGAGDHERLLVAFAWCLAQADREPERFGEGKILWEYRWVISVLPTFPEISRSTMDSMLADMVRRYESHGASLRPVHLLRRKIAIDMGDADMAADAAARWKNSPIDGHADSRATEVAFEITYQHFLKRPKRLLQVAEPLLTRKINSPYFEGHACAKALLPLLRDKRPAEAMPLHRRGYELRGPSPRHADTIAEHIQFLALTDNLPRALRLFEKHFPIAWASSNLFLRMCFLIDTLPLFERLRRAQAGRVSLRLPEACPAPQNKEGSEAEALDEWCRTTAVDLASRFDVRNGNGHYAGLIRAAPHLQRLFLPCPWNC